MALEKTVMVFRGSIFFNLNNCILERFTYGTLAAGAFPPAPAIASSDSYSNRKSYTLSLSGGYDVHWLAQESTIFSLTFLFYMSYCQT